MGEDEIKKELIFQILLVILVAMVGWQMTTLHHFEPTYKELKHSRRFFRTLQPKFLSLIHI